MEGTGAGPRASPSGTCGGAGRQRRGDSGGGRVKRRRPRRDGRLAYRVSVQEDEILAQSGARPDLY
jgi:hypothetical protein